MGNNEKTFNSSNPAAKCMVKYYQTRLNSQKNWLFPEPRCDKLYFVSYFHPRIGLTGEEDFALPLYEMLETEHSAIATLSKEEISAQPANSEIAKKLRIPKNSPILFRKRFVFDQGERPMAFNLSYYKADSFVYAVENTR